MNLQDILEKFNSLNPHEKIKFIYEKLGTLSSEYQIHLLLSVVKEESSTPTLLAAAIRFLPGSGFFNREFFYQFLVSPHPEVSRSAARALRELSIFEKKEEKRRRENQQENISAFKKQQRLKTLKELVKINASWVPKVMLEHLEDSSEEVREFIVDALSERNDLKLSTLHQKLLDRPWFTKSAVLKILSRKKNPSSLPYIEAVLDDSSSEVRQNAALALGEIGGDRASELLVKMTKDRNPYVRKKAKEALERASTLRFV